MSVKYFLVLILCSCSFVGVKGQQFNTDNYLTMPHGTSTITLTAGQRNSGVIASFSLIPNFEFFAQATMFYENTSLEIPSHFTTTVYAKYMFWVNEEKNGGGGVFLGIGKTPGYWANTEFIELHKNIWSAASFTFPLFDNAVSWDLMPGMVYDWSSEPESPGGWGFTYSTRVAVYGIIPQSALVGEVLGTEGDLFSPMEYRIGIRWEPNKFVIPAITYGNTFSGSGQGARLEVGVMIFSPPYLKKPLPE
ncbi:hypothetical protein [Namhaeicola litoreus]|uniref:MetA-pathway of phenol degradation n=1 Tax=Namhaeicola litoreus TaxID=1052145 RepID=A0ABW3Y2I3_9FLAO